MTPLGCLENHQPLLTNTPSVNPHSPWPCAMWTLDIYQSCRHRIAHSVGPLHTATATPPLPPNLMAHTRQALEAAWQALQGELAGMWADAMLPMVHVEWGECRSQLMQTRCATTTAAVQFWMQAVQWKQVARYAGVVGVWKNMCSWK